MKFGSITTGIIADGLVFNMDAANRASTIPSSATSTTNFFNTVNAFTLSFWVKLQSGGGGEQVFYTNRVNNNNRIVIYRFSNSSMYFHVNVGGSKNGNCSDPANDAWTNVVMVFNGNGSDNASKLKVYYNSSEQSLSYGGTLPSVTGTYSTSYLGARGDGSNAYKGNMSPIHIYNRALSANEVLHNYNALKGRFGL